MQNIDRQDRKSLRQFGLALGFMVALVFGLLGPWLFGREIRAWPFAAGIGLAGLALAWPVALYPVYRLLRPPLAALAALNNWVLLGIVFFLVLWPFGVFARLTRRLHYVRGFDASAPSYRVPRPASGRRDGPVDLDRPF